MSEPEGLTRNDKDEMEPFVTARWFKRAYSGTEYNELKRHPAYYMLDDNGKDGLLAFRVVGEASDLASLCTIKESMDLEEQRKRRQQMH